MKNWDNEKIAVIGLGYVGLPLAVAFGSKRSVIGFDINAVRISELQAGHDRTMEVDAEKLSQATHLKYTTDPAALRDCKIFIVTVPTPVDQAKRPNLSLLQSASATVGKYMPTGSLIIFESTVFPGCTEEVCVPIIAQQSGSSYNSGFFCGYSPERINPGDKEHRLETIVKVTSGSTPDVADAVDNLYRQIIVAGTYKATSIKVAEAAKVIENTQRDLNIALMNELAIIFERIGIDTTEVLEAAATKWNFLRFKPGLVGGHCIGVDPYYLTHKAQELGYHPEVILAGRRINDRMGQYVAANAVKRALYRRLPVAGARALVLGLAFKENCPDLRNTRVIDIIEALADYSMEVDVFDPWVDQEEARIEYGLDCLDTLPETAGYSIVVLAVAHDKFVEMGSEALRRLGVPDAVLFDVKAALPRGETDARL